MCKHSLMAATQRKRTRRGFVRFLSPSCKCRVSVEMKGARTGLCVEVSRGRGCRETSQATCRQTLGKAPGPLRSWEAGPASPCQVPSSQAKEARPFRGFWPADFLEQPPGCSAVQSRGFPPPEGKRAFLFLPPSATLLRHDGKRCFIQASEQPAAEFTRSGFLVPGSHPGSWCPTAGRLAFPLGSGTLKGTPPAAEYGVTGISARQGRGWEPGGSRRRSARAGGGPRRRR